MSPFGITNKFPSYRQSSIVSTTSWLAGKRADDCAEGLWRIHNTLYDFTNFITNHPGGEFWLEITKGTDITEVFESHHISKIPENMLSRYAVRETKNKRNYVFTMEENGFYKTLKSRIRTQLADLKHNTNSYSNAVHDALLFATIAFSIATALSFRMVYLFLSALCLCWLSITSHNYFHRRDNWRMYTFNLTLMNFNTWRISHALSHHMYPNSLMDLEMSMFEPFLCWIPDSKIATKLQRLFFVPFQPIIYALIYPGHLLIRVLISIFHSNILYWHDIIGFTLPILMCFISKEDKTLVLQQWLFIIAISSLIFGIIGLNAAHHDPKIYHEGDACRDDRDWGLYQIDTVIDRSDISGSQFLVLTHFGNHALHHMFPTLDHGLLPQLYPIFLQTLEEFKIQLRNCNHVEHIIGQNKQLLRTTANARKPEER